MEQLKIKHLKIRDLFGEKGSEFIEEQRVIRGWVRSLRKSKKFSFMVLNDGSCFSSFQIVIDANLSNYEEIKKIIAGYSVEVEGTIVRSQGKGQGLEMQASRVKIIGAVDESYPLQKKSTSMEFLREIAHLKARTNTFGAINRIRHAISFATHKFFNDKGFYYAHTPLITASDCEGAGELFKVTTLDLNQVPKTDKGEIDYSSDFYGKESFLTVSGQLNAECLALGLGQVYTFGPTFRAENSNTPRHLSEFWMVEPEVAFNDLAANCALADEYLKYLINYVLKNYRDDLEFLQKQNDEHLISKLSHVLESEFKVVEYTDAIEILKEASSKVNFEFKVEWGIDLQTEHERYLTEEHFNCPVTVINYPKDIKAFYMRMNDDGKTVAAMDVLVPGVGEIIGGSQREERPDALLERIREMGLPEENYWWYLDLRKFGSVPHAGFGMGLDRAVMYFTGISNIRDAIPFHRTPKSADF